MTCMGKAARAIVVENNRLLIMRRLKGGNQYYTLVGGQLKEGESLEAGLAREVNEETGLEVADARLVYTEMHPEPYNEQYIYLCTLKPHAPTLRIGEYSEEYALEQHSMGGNVHTPLWIDIGSFKHLAFRTPRLQEAIQLALKKGFPKNTVNL